MTLRAGGEGMIVSRQSPVGVSVSAMIKGDDCEVGGRGALLTAFQQSETLGVATLVHDRRGYAARVENSQSCEWFDGTLQYPSISRSPGS